MTRRLRKSFGTKGFRVNLSKNGIGFSTGIPGLRYSVDAKGKHRVTTSIPGTGISQTKTISAAKSNDQSNSQPAVIQKQDFDRTAESNAQFFTMVVFIGALGVLYFGYTFFSAITETNYPRAIFMLVLTLLTTFLSVYFNDKRLVFRETHKKILEQAKQQRKRQEEELERRRNFLGEYPMLLDRMTVKEFAQQIADTLEADDSTINYVNDDIAAFIANTETVRAVLICRSFKPVGIVVVRKLNELMAMSKLDDGILFTNSDFTSAARKFAKEKNILLFNSKQTSELVYECSRQVEDGENL